MVMPAKVMMSPTRRFRQAVVPTKDHETIVQSEEMGMHCRRWMIDRSLSGQVVERLGSMSVALSSKDLSRPSFVGAVYKRSGFAFVH